MNSVIIECWSPAYILTYGFILKNGLCYLKVNESVKDDRIQEKEVYYKGKKVHMNDLPKCLCLCENFTGKLKSLLKTCMMNYEKSDSISNNISHNILDGSVFTFIINKKDGETVNFSKQLTGKPKHGNMDWYLDGKLISSMYDVIQYVDDLFVQLDQIIISANEPGEVVEEFIHLSRKYPNLGVSDSEINSFANFPEGLDEELKNLVKY